MLTKTPNKIKIETILGPKHGLKCVPVATVPLGPVWTDSCQSLTKISKQCKKVKLNKEPQKASTEQ